MRHLHTRTTRRRVIAALTVLLFSAPGVTPVAVADETGTRSPTLADGLALTPPMGFNNWNSTHCRAEFNEAMVKGIADIFVEKGLKDAGYQYVNLDDCWALLGPGRRRQARPGPGPLPERDQGRRRLCALQGPGARDLHQRGHQDVQLRRFPGCVGP